MQKVEEEEGVEEEQQRKKRYGEPRQGRKDKKEEGEGVVMWSLVVVKLEHQAYLVLE